MTIEVKGGKTIRTGLPSPALKALSKLGEAPKRCVKKNMLAASSPKDKKLINFEATADFAKECKNFCTDNNLSMKDLFTEGAKLYMEKKEEGTI